MQKRIDRALTLSHTHRHTHTLSHAPGSANKDEATMNIIIIYFEQRTGRARAVNYANSAPAPAFTMATGRG